jgi:ribose transport system permease protein
VKRVLVVTYAFSGLCAAATALFMVSRFGVGQPYTGANYTLASITPVVIGGTLLAGGKGGVMGTLLGVYLMGLLNNLLNFMDISSHYQLVIQGLIVIVAVSAFPGRQGRRV